MKRFEITRSKRGLPCLWENGGGMTNTGESTIISGKDFSPKKPIYIRQKGMLSNNDHALIPVMAGDHIIVARHHRGDFTINIYEIIRVDEKEAVAELVYEFSNGEWNNEPPLEANAAIDAAKAKAMDYHCRKPYFIKE